jgi:hypothetical protein
VCESTQVAEQSTTDWGTYKEQKFISYSLEAGKSKIQVPAVFVLHLSVMSSHGRGKAAFWSSFIRALIPFIRGHSYDLITSKDPDC